MCLILGGMTGITRRIRPSLTLTSGLALGLALVAGCDDSGETRKDGAPTTAGTGPDSKANVPGDGKIAAPPALTKYKSPAEAIGAYNKCYSDCFTAQTNATNRETCKLDCDTLVETGMDTLPDEASKVTYKTTWTTLRTCVNGCWGDRKLNETNRATCLLTCSDSAEIGATPVPNGPGSQPGAAAGTPPGAAAGTPPAPGLLPVKSGTPPAKAAPTTGTPPATGTPPTGTPPAKAAPTTGTPPATGTTPARPTSPASPTPVTGNK